MQRGIRDFFSGGKGQARRPPSPATPYVSPNQQHHHQQQEGPPEKGAEHRQLQLQAMPVVQQFSRKRRRAEEPGDASLLSKHPSPPPAADKNAVLERLVQPPPLPSSRSGPRKQAGPSGGGTGRQLTQMHLDVGQRDFHLTKCAVCGLVYAKGEESDEKLHAAYHTSATKGLRYHASPGERVLLVDGAGGRVVLVPPGDGRSKKLQELCLFLEEQMGLVKGWLAAAPAALYMYVSPAKRVLGCVAAEGIKEAFPVVPQLDAAALAQLMSRGSAAQEASSRPDDDEPASPGASLEPATALPTGAATNRPAASITFSSRSPCAAGAGLQHERPVGRQRGSPHPPFVSCSAVADAAAVGPAERGGDERSAESSPEPEAAPCLPSAAQQLEQQQQQPLDAAWREPPLLDCPALVHGAGEGAQPAGPPPAPLQQQVLQQRNQDAPQRQACKQQQQQEEKDACSSAPLVVDRTRRVRAVCGVRVVWVSVEARRQGIATRLLDCVRSQFVRGYVVPRHELAFTQPSSQGQALIEAYASTRRFLVY